MPIVIVLFLLLIGCAAVPGFPGYISETVSPMDGTRQVRMTMHPLIGGVFLGVDWRSDWQDGELVLSAGTSPVERIATGESLHLRIGDEVFRLRALDQITEFDRNIPRMTVAYKRYAVDRALLEKIAAATPGDIVWRLHLGTGYIESVMDAYPGGTHDQMRRFLDRVDAAPA